MYEKLALPGQGSSVSRAGRLAGALSLHVNRPLHLQQVSETKKKKIN